MPTDAQLFFEEQKLASRYKVKLLGDYAEPFFYKLGSRYRRVWIVDGFAGPGTYDTADGQPSLGSPLTTASVARKVARSSSPSELRVINVEKDPALYGRLRQNLESFGPSTICLQGGFGGRVDEILQMIGDDPALFFIDPFGMTGTDVRLIDRILDRKARTVTELLINFSFRGFQRMAGNLTERPRSAARQKAADTKVAKLDEMLGCDRWRSVWTDSTLTSQEKCERVSELFGAALRGRGIKHVHPISMRDSIPGPVRYQLVFATRSSHGVYLMSDIVCRYERELVGSAEGHQLSLAGDIADNHREGRRDDLVTELHALGLALERATPERLRRILSPIHFGEFTEADYNWCIRRLVREGAISRTDERGIKRSEQLRFVNVDGRSASRDTVAGMRALIAHDDTLRGDRNGERSAESSARRDERPMSERA